MKSTNARRVRLVVSVRGPDEVAAALAGGAELIDVKEPDRGALGAADTAVIEAVIEAVDGRRPVSAALGELREGCVAPPRLAGALSLAKVGLAGCGRLDDWPQRWRQALERFPEGVAPVAVTYADWQTAAAPPPERILEVAALLGCRVLLIDTFDKSGGDLLERWPLPELAGFIRRVRQRRLAIALGGSLDSRTIAQVLPLAPEYIAVRSAACRGGRSASICEQRVRQVAHSIGRQSAESAASRADLAPSLPDDG